ncbi:MAG: molecular chaperone HtpG [Candidatus Sericytochromatia bacterium]|nr:molecular chaperone HtpG [Candidatus Sericytochromatia bacterium]
MTVETPAAEEKGQLSIHAENILPIIKKWLYSDHEIFLRELVSNGVDAVSKLKHVALVENLGELGPFRVEVRLDKDAKTLTIEDNGIGMTADEVRQYINTVAFSGAQDFVQRYQVDAEKNAIIGHFGLGFYSAFMVANKVEIHTLSYKAEAQACHWVSEGGLDFTLSPSDKAERGTRITLHLDEENQEFLEAVRVRHVLEKYARYLPVEILLDGAHINGQVPIWTQSPTSLKDEDYLTFFRAAYPFEEEPLFWIHLNVDYPFRLQGVLFFPKLKHEFDVSKGQVQLYCNNVFVTENVQDVIPRYLMVLKGMIDCPDIPLNVSRSMLQNDPYVKKIAGHITKKVADRLLQLYRTQREQYEGYWDDIHPFVKFGMLEDEKFFEAAEEAVIFRSTEGSFTTVSEYLARNEEKAKNQVYYAEAGDTQTTYVELFKSQGLEALYTQGPLDVHFIHLLESKNREVKWVRVDAGLSDQLVDKNAAQLLDADGKTQDEKLKETAERLLKERGVAIEVQRLKSEDISGLITQGEMERRLSDMSAMWKDRMELPTRKTLVLNANSPVVQKILVSSDDAQARDLAEHVHDLARLAHEGLKGEELSRFIARTHKLLGS